MSNKLYAIGDVHGCLETLKALLEKLSLDESDKVVFIGDYIDRGPDSKGVLDFLMNFEHENTTFLMGNHEKMLLDARSIKVDPTGQNYSLWIVNGGRETLRSFDRNVSFSRAVVGDLISKEYIDWMQGLKMSHVEDNFVFVHGGLKTNMGIMDQIDESNSRVLLWTRGHLKAEFNRPEVWEDNLTLVCGHTPQPEVLKRPWTICVDTGSCFKRPSLGTLSAIELRSNDVFSQDYIG